VRIWENSEHFCQDGNLHKRKRSATKLEAPEKSKRLIQRCGELAELLAKESAEELIAQPAAEQTTAV